MSEQSENVNSEATPMYQSSDPHLVWHEGWDEETEDIGFVATWSSGYQRDSLSRLNSLLIWPDKVEAVGPRIKVINDQTKFCSAHLIEEVLNYKNQLDKIPVGKYRSSLEQAGLYQSIRGGIVNSWYKVIMACIDSVLNGMFTSAANEDDILYFADVSSASCGFSEYILWIYFPLDLPDSPWNYLFNNDDDRSCSSSNSSEPPILSTKGFWFTSSNAAEKKDSDVAPMVARMPYYGDITKWVDLESFASLISRGSNGVGVHIVFATQGVSVDELRVTDNIQSKHTLVCQCLCALTILRSSGHFLMGLFDTLTEFTAGLIYIMGHLFEEIFIIKPIASDQLNPIRFLVCKSLRTELTSMAGCKPASPPPPRVNYDRECVSKHQKTVAGGSQKSHEFEVCENEAITKRIMMKTTTGTHRNDNGANDHYDEKKSHLNYDKSNNTNKSTPLSLVIKYLKQVNEKFKYIMTSRDCKIDILRMCRSEIMESDDKFMRFMRNMNEEIIIRQCITMSKVIAYAQDPPPRYARQNISAALWILIWNESLKPLPAEYHPSMRLTSLRKTDDIMNKLMSFTGRRIGLVCGSPSLTSTGAPAQPMLIFSRGRKNYPKVEICTVDGHECANLRELIPGLQPRLPNATLVWGQAINEISLKTGSEKPALFVYDVLWICGRDCRQMGYRNRMKLAERMVNVVNFPDMKASNIRVPPLMNLSRLEDYMNRLRLVLTGKSGKLVPMHCFPDGFAFQPHSLLLVEHLKVSENKFNRTNVYHN
uniref:Cap-specific mRNA (nucleoside-2'-O-)-methyltransferase 1 n=1 Tax=Trichobilharzia regenti TaxID=157069 RepID=A0AA85J1C9_TRIRE|nr:unnamed protein product [Trichobilharzia regenti]